VKPAPFNYHAPTRVSDVVALLAEHAGQASLLAGGQALMPLLASRTVRPRELIDLNRVPELSAVTRGGFGLRVGALVRLRQLEKDPELRATAPLLSAAAALAGPVQVRHRATVGGAMDIPFHRRRGLRPRWDTASASAAGRAGAGAARARSAGRSRSPAPW